MRIEISTQGPISRYVPDGAYALGDGGDREDRIETIIHSLERRTGLTNITSRIDSWREDGWTCYGVTFGRWLTKERYYTDIVEGWVYLDPPG